MLRFPVRYLALVNPNHLRCGRCVPTLFKSGLNRSNHFASPLSQTPILSFVAALHASTHSISSVPGLDDAVTRYILGEKKATEVSHLLWKQLVKEGDIVVDATCGNGNDTLAMAKMVKDDSGIGCVYGLDLQEDAIRNTSHLLDLSLDPVKRKSVKLFSICHSRMTEVLPKNSSVRLVAFNLGYLPGGGNKTIITKSDSTLQALKAAKEILCPGGLISVIAYVGHPGGSWLPNSLNPSKSDLAKSIKLTVMIFYGDLKGKDVKIFHRRGSWEEYEIVKGFASELPPESWSCTQIQMLNKSSTAPVLMFLFKR